MGFKFIEDGPKRENYPDAYRIDFGVIEYTAWEFIHEVIFEHDRDWGFIKFVDMEGTCLLALYYRYGELLTPIRGDIGFLVVVKAQAEGDQTRMDYTVTVKTPKDFERMDI